MRVRKKEASVSQPLTEGTNDNGQRWAHYRTKDVKAFLSEEEAYMIVRAFIEHTAYFMNPNLLDVADRYHYMIGSVEQAKMRVAKLLSRVTDATIPTHEISIGAVNTVYQGGYFEIRLTHTYLERDVICSRNYDLQLVSKSDVPAVDKIRMVVKSQNPGIPEDALTAAVQEVVAVL
jgi:hypothetical protein